MKILLLGFLALFGWSIFSTHFYVCKIKGLCGEPITMQQGEDRNNEISPVDTLSKPVVPEQPLFPEKMIMYFAFDKSEFKSDINTEKYYTESKAYLDQNLQSRLSITGYTDALGSDEYNLALGYRRAQSLQNYFERKGIPANKIIIDSKGEKQPADDNNTKEGRAKNRRSEITLKQ
jgi:outer membrane protein OmpA-like peptidoglycan-associated protein